MLAVLEYHMNYFSLFKAVDYHATVDVATSFLRNFVLRQLESEMKLAPGLVTWQHIDFS